MISPPGFGPPLLICSFLLAASSLSKSRDTGFKIPSSFMPRTFSPLGPKFYQDEEINCVSKETNFQK